MAEVWDRWQRGESLKAIGRVFRKEGSSVYSQIAPHGGIRPRTRCRSARVLTLVEREEISRGIAAHRSIRTIARLLGRSPSTISREIGRNGGYDQYRASEADTRAWERAHRPKSCRLVEHRGLRQRVDRKLRRNWPPEQISGWLEQTYPEAASYHVSHETIYRSLFIQARGALKKELTAHLRTRRTLRRTRQHAVRKGRGCEQINDIISIR